MDGYGIGQKKKITNSVPIPHDKITVWYWYYNHRLGYARGHHRPHRPRGRFYTSDGDWDAVVSIKVNDINGLRGLQSFFINPLKSMT